jgi:hypothetical protein
VCRVGARKVRVAPERHADVRFVGRPGHVPGASRGMRTRASPSVRTGEDFKGTPSRKVPDAGTPSVMSAPWRTGLPALPAVHRAPSSLLPGGGHGPRELRGAAAREAGVRQAGRRGRLVRGPGSGGAAVRPGPRGAAAAGCAAPRRNGGGGPAAGARPGPHGFQAVERAGPGAVGGRREVAVPWRRLATVARVTPATREISAAVTRADGWGMSCSHLSPGTGDTAQHPPHLLASLTPLSLTCLPIDASGRPVADGNCRGLPRTGRQRKPHEWRDLLDRDG